MDKLEFNFEKTDSNVVRFYSDWFLTSGKGIGRA
jgi:hypothetical protein